MQEANTSKNNIKILNIALGNDMSDSMRNKNMTISINSLRNNRNNNGSGDRKRIKKDFRTNIKSHGHMRSNRW